MSGSAGRRVFLSLGSNLGDRAGHLAAARAALAALPRTRLLAASHIYETAPQGFTDQADFLNQCVCIETEKEPHALLAATQRLEAEQGRLLAPRFGPRSLDIDILLFEAFESAEPALTLPHPRMTQRAFVLVPLLEIWGWARGMRTLDIAGLATATADAQGVRLWGVSEAGR